MAKTEKLENQETNVVEETQEVVEISYPLKRESYVDELRKKEMFSYHVRENVLINGVSKLCTIKVTCDKKDIDAFNVLEMMFDLGCNPVLVREAYSIKNETTGEVISGFYYFVKAVLNGTEQKLKVALMKASDKFVADLMFNIAK